MGVNPLEGFAGHPDLEPAAPAAVGQPNDTGSRLLAGKYKDEQELERGYLSQFNETQKIIAQRDAVQQKLDALMPLLGGGSDGFGAGRSMPSERVSARKSVLDDVAAATSTDRDQLTQEIAQIVRGELAPLTEGIRARQIVEQENPGFANFEGEVAQFLQANPEINRRFVNTMRVDPAAAMDYAFLKYQRAAGSGQLTPSAESRTSASGQDQLQARLDATIPAPGAGTRSDGAAAQAQQNYSAAKAKGERTGDWTEFLGLHLQGVVPESHTR